MTETLAPTRPPSRRPASCEPHLGKRPERARRAGRGGRRPLGHYVDRQGRRREVIVRRGSAGSLLVVDRDELTGGDGRLVAHLGADEPNENAVLVCGHYLHDVRADRCRCRPLSSEDLCGAPFSEAAESEPLPEARLGETQARDGFGRSYSLRLLSGAMSIPELRWSRCAPDGALRSIETVRLRDVVARLESYEPACTVTRRALQAHASAEVSTTVLRLELARLLESPIVLNRRLREVVLENVHARQLSMSEIATRCGRIKRDRKGNESGETSWLARRLGLLPEGGQTAPTPWIHSDVLGLIARNGLGLSPREVEL